MSLLVILTFIKPSLFRVKRTAQITDIFLMAVGFVCVIKPSEFDTTFMSSEEKRNHQFNLRINNCKSLARLTENVTKQLEDSLSGIWSCYRELSGKLL